MTYADLLKVLQKLNPEQLQQDVTVYDADDDETYALNAHDVVGNEAEGVEGPAGVLDDGHFYLVRTF